MSNRLVVATAVLVAVGLSGCAGSPSGGAPSAPEPGLPSMGAGGLSTPSPITLDATRRQAITADLAARGVTGTMIVVTAQAVTWPNGALGCPQPGRVYAQVLTPGFQVVVAVGNTHYDYRFGGGTTPVLCEK